MNSSMQGHNHGGKNHLIGMLGIGAVVVVVLLAAGRSFREALPLAAVLACPLMMIGMMFMMRGGNSQQQNGSSADHGRHDTPTDGADPASGPLRRSAFSSLTTPRRPTDDISRP